MKAINTFLTQIDPNSDLIPIEIKKNQNLINLLQTKLINYYSYMFNQNTTNELVYTDKDFLFELFRNLKIKYDMDKLVLIEVYEVLINVSMKIKDYQCGTAFESGLNSAGFWGL